MVHLNKMMKINLYIASAISIALLGGCGGSGSSGANFEESGNFIGPGSTELKPIDNDGGTANIFLVDEGDTKTSGIPQQNSPSVAIIDFDQSRNLSKNDVIKYNQVSFVSEACVVKNCSNNSSLGEDFKEAWSNLFVILDVNGRFNTLRGPATVDRPLAAGSPSVIKNDVALSKIDAERRDGTLHKYSGTIDRRFNGIMVLNAINGNDVGDIRSTYIRAPESAGWSYQTFLRYFSNAESPELNVRRDLLQGYQSIGAPTKTGDLPKNGWADYNGIAHALYNGFQVTMQNNIHADFANRTLSFDSTNATLHTFENGSHIIERRPDLDLTGTASWAKGVPDFSGDIRAKGDSALKGRIEGRFYGLQAAEVGGVFGLSKVTSDGQNNYIGGFGAKRN